MINELIDLIPEPEEEIGIKVLERVIESFNSHKLKDYNILVKFWIMAGLSGSDLLKLLPHDKIESNAWDWIHWDAQIKGDNQTLSLISDLEDGQIKSSSPQEDFLLWEHWLLKFDPNFKNSEEIRNKAYDELTELAEKSKIQYFPLYELYTEIHKENTSIPDEKHIIKLDKILSNTDWKSLGHFWQSIALYEFARIQTDFSDITGAVETIQDMKNISWQNPYFLGLLLRLEAKLSFIQKEYDEMDHLIQSSLFFFQKIDNKKEIIYTKLLQSNYWSIKSKEKAMKVLTEIDKEMLNSINDPWLEGYYYSNLANFYSADSKPQESCHYFNQSAIFFNKTIDKIKFLRNFIDYGFGLYVIKKFDDISVVIEKLKKENLPTMYEFRIAYLNSITHYKKSNIKEAIQSLEGSIQEAQQVLVSPHLPWFYSLLAEIYRVQGKWTLVIDYFNLAMKAYFQLNEIENALRTKLAISLHHFLMNDIQKAIDTAKDIAINNGLNLNLKLEVYWILFKYNLFSKSNASKISEKTLNNLLTISEQTFSSDFHFFIRQMTEILPQPNKDEKILIELIENLNSVFDSDNKLHLEKEWIVELKILLVYYILKENELTNLIKLDIKEEISIHDEFSYPVTVNDQKLNSLINDLVKSDNRLFKNEKINEIQNTLLQTSFERNIIRVISPIFPLKLY